MCWDSYFTRWRYQSNSWCWCQRIAWECCSPSKVLGRQPSQLHHHLRARNRRTSHSISPWRVPIPPERNLFPAKHQEWRLSTNAIRGNYTGRIREKKCRTLTTQLWKHLWVKIKSWPRKRSVLWWWQLRRKKERMNKQAKQMMNYIYFRSSIIWLLLTKRVTINSLFNNNLFSFRQINLIILNFLYSIYLSLKFRQVK